eukprot:6206064-Pleurochrysis_carterae.AAC.1
MSACGRARARGQSSGGASQPEGPSKKANGVWARCAPAAPQLAAFLLFLPVVWRRDGRAGSAPISERRLAPQSAVPLTSLTALGVPSP